MQAQWLSDPGLKTTASFDNHQDTGGRLAEGVARGCGVEIEAL